MPRMEITYRSYQPGDEGHILALYNSVFGTHRSVAQWEWEYNRRPRDGHAICLAFAGTRLVGHTAAAPLTFSCDVQVAKVMRKQHGVVDPDFQRQGIFTEMMNQLTKTLFVRGIDLAIGFTRDERHSTEGVLRTRPYVHAFDIWALGRPLPLASSPVAGLLIEISDPPDFRDTDVNCAEEFLSRFAIHNRRDLPYLNWRYHRASGRRYAMARVWHHGNQIGWAVAKIYPPKNSLDVVECFLPSEPATISSVINALSDHFRDKGLKRCSMWSMQHDPLNQCMTELGFTPEASPTHVLVAALSSRCTVSSKGAGAYYLAMGDSDVY